MSRENLIPALVDDGWTETHRDQVRVVLERDGWSCFVNTTGLVELMTIPLFTVRATWAVPDEVLIRRIEAVTR